MEALFAPDLTNVRVLLAVSGGIAAYKSAELCRELMRCGAQVQVAMTEAAQQFVGPATFAALTSNPVATSPFDPQEEERIGHIRLADGNHLLIVAPATANTLAKFTHGLADELVSTLYLAFTGPVLLAPAMNVHMWEHPATQANMEVLKQRPRHHLVGPARGALACGYEGEGRMAELEDIMQAVGSCLCLQDFQGKHVVVSAGPTHEPLDPVRFIANRSSGKMGFALAAEAAARGAKVTLVAGPSKLPTPRGVTRLDVVCAADMASIMLELAYTCDMVFMAAAVADYSPEVQAATKLKKELLGAQPVISLTLNPDILGTLGALNKKPFLVGFAAETEADLDRLGPEKLRRKGCDLLVANNVAQAGAGFDTPTNAGVVYDRKGRVLDIPLCSKRVMARLILDQVIERVSK